MEDKDPIINKLKKYKNTSDYQLSEEEIDYLNKNYHKITTKRGEIAYIIENRYLFRKEAIYKRDNSILFRCHIEKLKNVHVLLFLKIIKLLMVI